MRQLMAAYFHQDWSLEYHGSWQAAVDDFARRAPERLRSTIAEIDSLLDGQPSDDER